MLSSSLLLPFTFLLFPVSLEVCCSGQELPEHEREDASMLVVIDLDRRIYAQRERHFFSLAAGAVNDHRHVHARLDAALKASDGKRLRPVEIESRGARALFKLAGEHAHADEVAAMYALEALGHDRFDAEQQRSLRRPVARAASAVLLSCQDDERDTGGLVLDRGIVDGHALAVRLVHSDATLRAGNHQVLDAYVGERAAHHHLMIAAPRAVRVEVFDGDAVFL